MRTKVITICGLIVLASAMMLQRPGFAAKGEAGTAVTQKTATALFSKHCASCHGKDGKAKTFKAKFNHARNLTEPGWQDAVSDERISNSITNGRGKMPAFAKKLSEAEIDSLVILVRGLKKE